MEFFKKAAEETAALQAKWLEQSFKAMDDCNALAKAQLKYWVDLQAEARKMANGFGS